jgi:hypothetical protein
LKLFHITCKNDNIERIHIVENLLWKRLYTYGKTGNGINECGPGEWRIRYNKVYKLYDVGALSIFLCLKRLQWDGH